MGHKKKIKKIKTTDFAQLLKKVGFVEVQAGRFERNLSDSSGDLKVSGDNDNITPPSNAAVTEDVIKQDVAASGEIQAESDII